MVAINAHRPLFRRGDTFVVVKPIRLSAKQILKPGTKVSLKKYRHFQLLSWYRRGAIGQAGSDWAKNALEAFKAKAPAKKKSKPKPKPKKNPPETPETDNNKATETDTDITANTEQETKEESNDNDTESNETTDE